MSRVFAFLLVLFLASAALADPSPAPIGRLAAVSGAVSYTPSADAAPADAAVNMPLTAGNRIATAPRAHSVVDIAAGRFYLDGDSAMTIGALGPGMASIALERGAVVLHILPGGAGQVFVIQTPRGAFRADQPGYFEVEIAAKTGTVAVSAFEGGAQFADTTVLPPGARAITAGNNVPVLGAAIEDDFIRRVAGEVEESGENKLEAPKYVSAQTTGFHELLRDGLWALTEQYGWVWEPQVMSDWAPFHDGRWIELAPWGRTWIDNAPWGFATTHYGCWVEVHERWAWVPDNPVRPGSAPAVVGVFGSKDQKGGWVPLGPEEPSVSGAPVIVNTVRAIDKPDPPKIINNTTVNNTTNVTTVVKPTRQPSLVVIPSFVPSPLPPTPPSPAPSAPSNLTGLGAGGAPMQGGVAFPGQ